MNLSEYKEVVRNSIRAHKARKYHNKPIVTSYGKFDSVHERNVYELLLERRFKGEIEELHRQVKFELIPKVTEPYTEVRHLKKGDKIIEKVRTIEEACCYIADFTYIENGQLVVVDAKSPITQKNPEYIIKRKLMLFRHGIRIIEM